MRGGYERLASGVQSQPRNRGTTGSPYIIERSAQATPFLMLRFLCYLHMVVWRSPEFP
jgi:hypothetical protein